MKTKFIVIAALTISLLIPVHSAFAYGGGGGDGGGGEMSTSGLRDSNEPPAGFQSSEVPTHVDSSKSIRATGQITITRESDETRSYETDETALTNGDTITTKGFVTITWPGGAKMNLNPNTQIQIRGSTQAPIVRVLEGRTYIRLTYDEKTKKFQAIIPNVRGVRG